MSENLFKMPKTLSLELVPLPQTAEKLKMYHKIENDVELHDKVERAKSLLDEFHLAFINESLAEIKRNVSWNNLFDALYTADTSDESDEAKKNARSAAIKAILAIFRGMPDYEYINTPTPSRMLQEKLIPLYPDEPALRIQAEYLKPFHINRQILYGSKKGSIISRLVYDNMYLYVNNAKAWTKLKETCPDNADEILTHLEGEDITENLEALFTADGYARCLTQRGVEVYNTVLNGFTDANGIYHYGILKYISLLKKDEKTGSLFKSKEWPTFNKLQKILLQDASAESLSFIPKQFASDDEMFKAIYDFCDRMKEQAVLGNIEEALDDIRQGYITGEDITIFKDALSKVSNAVYGRWDTIDETLEMYVNEGFAKKKDAKAFKKDKTITIAKVQEIMDKYGYEGDILRFWYKQNPRIDVTNLETAAKMLKSNLEGAEIKDKKELLPDIESAFSKLSQTVSTLMLLLGGKKSRKKEMVFENDAFRFIAEPLTMLSENCHFLFCTSRSWCTRKPYSTAKIEMSFGFPSFGQGFAESVIPKKGCMIFRREREYFFGILNSANKPSPDDLYVNVDKTSKTYSLFSYSLRAMSITRIIFAASNAELFAPIGLDDEMREGYEKKRYREDPVFLKRLINLTMDALRLYPSWAKIAWDLGKAEDYDSWKKFSDKVSEQAVTVEMHQCNEKTLMKMVDDGSMFLFKITSHGMKKYEKGLPTKDKMSEYFIRAIENVSKEDETEVALLNNCSVYYRPASIVSPFVHRKGDILVDKKDRSGVPIPGRIYKELFRFYTHGEKNYDALSAEARAYIRDGRLITKRAGFDIIKDRRFTLDKYLLHIPVVVNSDAGFDLASDADHTAALETVNDEAYAMYEKSGRVIGITRGANHLVCYCVIDRDGYVIEEGNFDVIGEKDDKGAIKRSMNYRVKLEQLNAERQARAKTWQERGDIAGIQDGYLKSVVREIIELSEKHKALIAVEDMSYDKSTKSISSILEAVSYRKFIAELLDSFSCYVPDKTNMGVIRQYTVGNRSVKDNVGQNGRVVFVKAVRLQNTDPVTGFCNLFRSLHLEKKDDLLKFFRTFKTIEAGDDSVTLQFRYSDFGLKDLRGMNDEWTLRISGKRFAFEIDPNDKRNRRMLVVHHPANEMIAIAGDGKKNVRAAVTDDSVTVEDLRKMRDALMLGLRTRLVGKIGNESFDVFVSSACDKDGNTFVSGTVKGYPTSTDTVLAYNIAKTYID